MKIVILSVTSYGLLFLLTKIMGNRQMSQLSMFDYIVGITIGSIAAEMATSLEDNYLEPMIAMVIYAGLSVLMAFVSAKSIRISEFLEGKAIVLLDGGELYRHNFTAARLDLNEFLMKCRVSGYFNLSELETVILESNGKLSFIPKATARQVKTADLGLLPNQEHPVFLLIMDGELQEEDLRSAGKNEVWLREQLQKQGFADYAEVFLAYCDCDGNLSSYRMQKKKSFRESIRFWEK